VRSTPQSTVFLDGQHLGQTPLDNDKLKSGDYVLKIVPESGGQALSPWEGRIALTGGIQTVVSRDLGLTPDLSAGEILSFEPIADKSSASISVVSTPDGAVVNLDGEPRGFAPISLDKISEGEHNLVITSPGFSDRTIKAKTIKGNKLIVAVQLARQGETEVQEETAAVATSSASPKASPKASVKPVPSATASASPKASPKASGAAISRPYVQINSPDTGWVRVRSEPSTAATELTKVDHGEQFPLKDAQNGWYEIEYESGKTGWISGKYAEKFE